MIARPKVTTSHLRGATLTTGVAAMAPNHRERHRDGDRSVEYIIVGFPGKPPASPFDVDVQMTPSRRPVSTASARDATPSLRYTVRTCDLSVLSDTNKAAAIS